MLPMGNDVVPRALYKLKVFQIKILLFNKL